MPKAKPEGNGLTAETVTRKGRLSYTIVDYRLPAMIDDKKVERTIFESSTAQTRDYVLQRMLERAAEKLANLNLIEIR